MLKPCEIYFDLLGLYSISNDVQKMREHMKNLVEGILNLISNTSAQKIDFQEKLQSIANLLQKNVETCNETRIIAENSSQKIDGLVDISDQIRDITLVIWNFNVIICT